MVRAYKNFRSRFKSNIVQVDCNKRLETKLKYTSIFLFCDFKHILIMFSKHTDLLKRIFNHKANESKVFLNCICVTVICNTRPGHLAISFLAWVLAAPSEVAMARAVPKKNVGIPL